MKIQGLEKKAGGYAGMALMALSFAIPLFPRLLPLLILIVIIFLIIDNRKRFVDTFVNPLKNINGNVGLILLFLLYLVGMSYSVNMQYGWFDIGIKLPLLILPFFVNSQSIKTSCLPRIFKAFIAACFISVVYNLLASFVEYQGDVSVFYYYKVSRMFHASYQALYLCFALILLLHVYSDAGKIWQKITLIFLMILFSLYIVLLSSKAGLIGLFLIWTLYWIWMAFNSKRIVLFAVSLIVTLVLIYGTTRLFSYSASRFQNAVETIQKNNQGENITNGTSERVMIWKVAAGLFKENPLGVGTGDVKDKLLEKYLENGMTDVYQKKLNAHNQFLQTAVTLGIPGIVLLLLSFMLPLKKINKSNAFLLLSALLLYGMNFMFESMLEVQAGVTFFAFFLALISSDILERKVKD